MQNLRTEGGAVRAEGSLNGDLEDGEEIWQVPVEDILRHWDPFAAWCPNPITASEVHQALDEGWLDPVPFDTLPWAFQRQDEEQTRHYHRCRIAWLVVHPDNTPIDIDVGAPSLGWHPRGGDFDFIDGNHWLCAAVIRGDATIRVSYGGECDQMGILFPQGWKEGTYKAE